MIDGGVYHIEVADRQATIYLTGELTTAVRLLIDACSALPANVNVLRLDLDGVDRLGEAGLAAVDQVRLHWLSTREGSFRVAFAIRSRPRSVPYQVEASM